MPVKISYPERRENPANSARAEHALDSSATVFAMAPITSSASVVSTLPKPPVGAGYSAKKSSISSTIIQ